MELKKAKELRSLEYKRELPFPKFANTLSKDDLDELMSLEFNLSTRNFQNIIKYSKIVKKFKGNGTIHSPIYMETDFAKGYFFDVHYLFSNKKYTQVAPGACFDNAYKTALGLTKLGVENKVLNGLSWYEYSACHSINLVNNAWIIDYNFGVVMQKDLYFKTFPFEILETIDGKMILENHLLVKKYITHGFEKMFCYNLLVSQVKNGEIETKDYENKLYLMENKNEEVYDIYQQRFEDKFVWPKKLNKKRGTKNLVQETNTNKNTEDVEIEANENFDSFC